MTQSHTTDGMAAEQISLAVPPRAGYARLVRMTAANLAAVAGLPVDAVEDVRMAAEEAFVCAGSSHPSAPLHIDMALSAQRLEMLFDLGQTGAAGDDGSQEAQDAQGVQDSDAEGASQDLAYARLLLEALCDVEELAATDASPARLRVVMTIGAADVL